MARSFDVESLRPGVDGGRPAVSTASQSSAYVQQIVGCVFGGALALSLLVVTAFILCRRGRRGRRRAAVSKATAAAAVAGARSTSSFRLFGVRATSMTRDDSVTLTSTGKTTSNGLSSFSNCSISPAGAADNDDDDQHYDITATLARCFRLPHDVIQARQLPKPPPPPPHLSSPYQPQYLAGMPFIFGHRNGSHHHHHHPRPHHTTGLTWCRHSSASGPRYKVSVTHVVSLIPIATNVVCCCCCCCCCY